MITYDLLFTGKKLNLIRYKDYIFGPYKGQLINIVADYTGGVEILVTTSVSLKPRRKELKRMFKRARPKLRCTIRLIKEEAVYFHMPLVLVKNKENRIFQAVEQIVSVMGEFQNISYSDQEVILDGVIPKLAADVKSIQNINRGEEIQLPSRDKANLNKRGDKVIAFIFLLGFLYMFAVVVFLNNKKIEPSLNIDAVKYTVLFHIMIMASVFVAARISKPIRLSMTHIEATKMNLFCQILVYLVIPIFYTFANFALFSYLIR